MILERSKIIRDYPRLLAEREKEREEGREFRIL